MCVYDVYFVCMLGEVFFAGWFWCYALSAPYSPKCVTTWWHNKKPYQQQQHLVFTEWPAATQSCLYLPPRNFPHTQWTQTYTQKNLITCGPPHSEKLADGRPNHSSVLIQIGRFCPTSRQRRCGNDLPSKPSNTLTKLWLLFGGLWMCMCVCLCVWFSSPFGELQSISPIYNFGTMHDNIDDDAEWMSTRYHRFRMVLRLLLVRLLANICMMVGWETLYIYISSVVYIL